MKDLNPHTEQLLKQVYSPSFVNILMDMLSILDKHGMQDYIQPLSELADTDDVDHDPNIRADKIKNIIYNNVLKYLNQRGIIISDIAHLADFYIVYLILDAMEKLLDLSIGDSLFIYSVLDDDRDNVDKLFLILNYLNPAINKDNFNILIEDVYDEFFTILTKVVEDTINNSDIEIDTDDLPNTTIVLNNLLDELIKLGYNNSPHVILDMVVSPEMIKVYYLNTDSIFKKSLKHISLLAKEINGSEYDSVILNEIDDIILDLIIVILLRYNNKEESKQLFTELLENLELDNLNKTIEVTKKHIDTLNTKSFTDILNNIVDILNLENMVNDDQENKND